MVIRRRLFAAFLALTTLAEAVLAQTTRGRPRPITDIISRFQAGSYCASRSSFASELRPYAELVAANYGLRPIPEGWQLMKVERSQDTLLRFNLYTNGPDAVGVVQGIFPPTMPAELPTEIGAIISRRPSPAFRLALSAFGELHQRYPSLQIVGHSKGGGIVNYVSSFTGIPGIAFNAEPITGPLGNMTRSLGVGMRSDFLEQLANLLGVNNSTARSLVRAQCADCHDINTLLNALNRSAQGTTGAGPKLKCTLPPPPGPAFTCKPSGDLDALMEAIKIGNWSIAFTSECLQHREGVTEEVRPIANYNCRGGTVIGIAGATTDWTRSRGYAGMHSDGTHKYNGYPFMTPCLHQCFLGARIADDTQLFSNLCR